MNITYITNNKALFPYEDEEEKYRNESIATVQLDMMESRLKKVRVKDGIINIVGLVLQKIEIAILSSVNYLAIYYIYYLHTYDKNISKENSLTLSSILVFAQFSTIFIGGILKEYIGMRLVMLIGGLFLILGSLGIIFFKSLTVYKIMMLFYGMGIGIPGSITNVNASLFIPERKGLINGISNIAWTLSCSLFNFVGLQVANPHSLDIEFKDEDKVKGKEYFNDDGESANNQPMELDNKSKKKKKKKGDDITFKSYLKHWRFYTCFIIFSFKNVHPNLIISSFQVFAIHYESVSTSAQKIITTTSFIVNLFTTFCLSFFVDKFRYRLVIIPTFLLILVHSLTFQFIVKHGVLYVVYFFAVGLLVSIDNLASFPHFMKIFGGRFFARELVFSILQ